MQRVGASALGRIWRAAMWGMPSDSDIFTHRGRVRRRASRVRGTAWLVGASASGRGRAWVSRHGDIRRVDDVGARWSRAPIASWSVSGRWCTSPRDLGRARRSERRSLGRSGEGDDPRRAPSAAQTSASWPRANRCTMGAVAGRRATSSVERSIRNASRVTVGILGCGSPQSFKVGPRAIPTAENPRLATGDERSGDPLGLGRPSARSCLRRPRGRAIRR